MHMFSRLFVIALFLLVVLITASNAPAREWTAKSGHKITGDFVSLQNGIVKISQPNGFAAEIPLNQLSDADQKLGTNDSPVEHDAKGRTGKT